LLGREALVGDSLVKSLLSRETLVESLLSSNTLVESLLSSESLVESLLSSNTLVQSLLSSETLLLVGIRTEVVVLLVGLKTFVDDLMGVDGGLHDVLSEMLLGVLDDGDNALAVDDGLDFINNIGIDLLLNDGLVLKGVDGLGSCWFNDVPLDVMDNVLVNAAMKDRLYFHDVVITDCLLDDGC